MSKVKYIFSVNPGRSGSDYSTSIFKHAKECESLHEASPALFGEVMIEYNKGNRQPMIDMIPKKIAVMEKALADSKKRVLFDSNHCFIKGFGWEIVKHIPHDQIAVLFIRRDPDANAKGLLRIHDVPGMNRLSRDWYLQPGYPENRTEPPKGANRLELCRWYVDEVFVRGAEFREKYPQITYVDTTLDELNDYERVVEIFATFGLEPLDSLKEAVGKRQNARTVYPKLDLERALRPFRLRDPASLPKREAGLLRRRIVQYLLERREFKEMELVEMFPGMGVSLFGGIITTLFQPGFLDEVAEHFDVEIMYTELEHGIMKELVYHMREGKLWPMCLFDRLIVQRLPPLDEEEMDPFTDLSGWGCLIPHRFSMPIWILKCFLGYFYDNLWRPAAVRYALLCVLALLLLYVLL